jgi:hypothetical protein
MEGVSYAEPGYVVTLALTNGGVRRPWCGDLTEYVPEFDA